MMVKTDHHVALQYSARDKTGFGTRERGLRELSEPHHTIQSTEGHQYHAGRTSVSADPLKELSRTCVASLGQGAISSRFPKDRRG